MKISEIVEIFANEISSESIMRNIECLTQFHRIQGSKNFFDALNHIKNILENNSIESIIHEFPADGEWENWGWKVPISWDITSAELFLVKPHKKRLSRYKDIPMSVITHSRKSNFEAEVVDIGKGDKLSDYAKADGKIALITASPRDVFTLAAKNNVKGILLHPNLERAAKIGSQTVQYDGFWPDSDTFSQVLSGFSLSHHQALEIQKYLEMKEEVRVHFQIDANFRKDDGQLHVLEAFVHGNELPDEEIVLIAHLCHPAPGANDNASGSSTLLELILTFNHLIKNGVLHHPKRTIRFLWVPEFSGTIPWLKQYEEKNKDKNRIIACLNLDMVGERNVPLRISSPSISNPSFLRALLDMTAEHVANLTPIPFSDRIYQLKYIIVPFEGGSDHLLFNDLYFGIPSAMFTHNDFYWHSSADSIDKVDPLECQSVALIVAAIFYGLALSDDDFLHDLLLKTHMDGINQAVEYELNSNSRKDLTIDQIEKQIEILESISSKQLKSILDIVLTDIITSDIQNYLKFIEDYYKQLRNNILPDKVNSTALIKKNEILNKKFRRNYIGPLPFSKLMNKNRSESKEIIFKRISKDHWTGIPIELLNLSNGVLTANEIFLTLRIQYPDIVLKDILNLFKIFHKEGLLIEM